MGRLLFTVITTWLMLQESTADWLVTTLPNQAASTALHNKLVEEFGEKIEGVYSVDIQSHFWTEDAVVGEREVRMTLDSDVPFSQLRELVENAHPYKLPMIITSANAGRDLITSKGPSDRYLMGTVDVNDTTLNMVSNLAKELVEVRFAAYSQVEKLGEEKGRHRITLKTTGDCKEQLVREFGGLQFEWTAIRSNVPFMTYIDTHVKIQTTEL